MAVTDRAICLRATDYSETSQVLTLLTRAGGVVRLLAKGTKRPKSKSGGRLDLLSEGQVLYSGAGREALGTLMEFVEQTSHSALRKSLGRLNTALYMLELCGVLLGEGDPHAEVFDLLHNALARLGEPDASPPAVLAYFQFRLVRHAGLLGRMDVCAACGSGLGPRGTYFSSSAGGMLCRNCEPGATEKYAVSADALSGLAALAAAAAGKKVRLADSQANAVNALLAYHVEYQLGKRLKLARLAAGE